MAPNDREERDDIPLSRTELREEMRQMIAETIAALEKKKQPAIALKTPQQKPSDIATVITPNQPSKLKAEEIGYFDPAAEGEGDIVTSGNHIIYKDVYDFKDRINTCKLHYSDEEVKNLIPACLRGDSLKWHSNEIHEDTKKLLARSISCEECTDELIKRFKLKTSISLARIHATTYGLNEVKKGVLARQHANNILKLTKSAEVESVKNRLTYIYMSFAYEFKQDLRAPTEKTTIEEYFKILDELQETWEERAHRSHRRPSPPPKPNRLAERTQPSFRTRSWPLQEISLKILSDVSWFDHWRWQQTLDF